MSEDKRIPVAVLGATGSVGQRFVQLLEHHPWFRVAELVASERSVGKPYREATDWRLDAFMPECASNLIVRDYADHINSPVAFCLAGRSRRGNRATPRPGGPYRALQHVNASDGAGRPLADSGGQSRSRPGDRNAKSRSRLVRVIATNPNCSAIHMVLTLKPLQDAFGIDEVMVTTMQAVSGAGYPGVSSLDAIDNVVPFIRTEEEKMAEETRKLLGEWDKDFIPAEIVISASCNRVSVRDGHTECVSIRLQKDVSPEDVADVIGDLPGTSAELGLPSAPKRPIIVRDEPNRPQPILDRTAENGMASVVGRIRPCPVMGIKYVLLGHNTIRGAAGASILNAELFKVEGLLPV